MKLRSCRLLHSVRKLGGEYFILLQFLSASLQIYESPREMLSALVSRVFMFDTAHQSNDSASSTNVVDVRDSSARNAYRFETQHRMNSCYNQVS